MELVIPRDFCRVLVGSRLRVRKSCEISTALVAGTRRLLTCRIVQQVGGLYRRPWLRRRYRAWRWPGSLRSGCKSRSFDDDEVDVCQEEVQKWSEVRGLVYVGQDAVDPCVVKSHNGKLIHSHLSTSGLRLTKRLLVR